VAGSEPSSNVVKTRGAVSRAFRRRAGRRRLPPSILQKILSRGQPLGVSASGGVFCRVPTASSSCVSISRKRSRLPQAPDDDVAARWVRYLGHMNTANGFNSVTEVSVFGVP
jgi:hypothetical protein